MSETDTPQTPDTAPPPPAKPKRRRWRWLLWLPLLLIALLLAASAWLTGSRAGFAWLMQSLGGLSGNAVSVKKAEGTLWDGFKLSEVRVRSAGSDVDIESVQLDWRPSALWQRQLWVRQLAVGHVKVAVKPTPAAPSSGAPESLALPLGVRLDRLSVASVTLEPAKLRLYGLEAGYVYDSRRHDLKLKRLGSPWGEAAAALQLADAKPFALQGKLSADGELDKIPYQARLALGGDLLHLSFDGELSGKDLVADVKGGLLPFASNPFNSFTRLDARMAGINPQAILPEWPRAKLSLAVFAEPDAGQRVKGGLTLLNELAGPLSEQRLPLSLLAGEFRADDKALELFNTHARIAGGEIGLAGQLRPDRLKLALDVSKLGLRQLHADAPDDSLDGRVTLDGPLSGPNILAQLKGKTLQAKADVGFAPAPHPALLIRQAELTAGVGTLALAGQLGLDGKQLFDFNGKLNRADPSKLKPGLPSGDLNASLQAKGQLASPLSVAAKLQFAPSKLSGAPLSGGADLQLQGERLKSLSADLKLAQNRLQANGAYGAAGDKLKLLIDAPNLGLIGPGFSGVVKGQGELAGTPKAPLISANLQADRLKLPGNIAVQSMQFSGNVKADQNSPFQLKLDVAALQAGGFRAEQLRASANGTRARHGLQLDGRFRLADHPYALQLAASGGLRGEAGPWAGTLSKLELSGRPGLSLLAPVALELGEQIKVGNARLSALGGSITLAELNRGANGALSTRGSARGLRLAELGPLLSLPVKQDLSFDSDWNLNLAANAKGQFTLRRAGGDVQLPGDKGKDVALGLKTAAVTLTLDGGRALFDLNLDSRYAQAQGKGSVPWNGGAIDAKTPLNATVSASVPSLATLASFAGPSLELGGQISANLALTGALSQPMAQGTIRGDKLLLADRRTGIRLGDGSLLARLDGRKLVLDRLRFAGGEGEVAASGALDLSGDTPDARVAVELRKFGVFDRPNRRLVVSGRTELAMVAGKLSLTGHIRADQGRIGLPKFGAPSLGDDVMVKGRPGPEPSAFASMPLTVALDLDLGDHFRFSGQGLNVDLTGSVRVSANPGEAPGAKGQVRVVKGRYKAYGQDLDIEYGAITFNGPLDNPLLNVRAKRRLSPVGAGVEVSGSVSVPKVRLIADEPMSEKDKLAWLVLGRAASGERDDNDLAASAGMMLAGSLNDQIGLFDDLGVSSRKEKTLANGTVSPAEQVVTVGRQLTRELYLGYEYGVTSANQAVKLAYQLSRGWSVVLRAGTDASVESRYTLRFD